MSESYEPTIEKTVKRTDYPLCPHCGTEIAVFYPPNEPERISLYCPGTKGKKCTGLGADNKTPNGYHIMLSDITFKYN
jgi:hypothetical protein